MLITCFGRTRMTSGIQLDGYPDSFWLHCFRTPVRRGAMPAVVAPGRKRPMTRSHADGDWRSNDPEGLMIGSCCVGIHRSGGSLRSVSPKNPGGAMPITVNGCPSMKNAEPTTDGFESKLASHA